MALAFVWYNFKPKIEGRFAKGESLEIIDLKNLLKNKKINDVTTKFSLPKQNRVGRRGFALIETSVVGF